MPGAAGVTVGNFESEAGGSLAEIGGRLQLLPWLKEFENLGVCEWREKWMCDGLVVWCEVSSNAGFASNHCGLEGGRVRTQSSWLASQSLVQPFTYGPDVWVGPKSSCESTATAPCVLKGGNWDSSGVWVEYLPGATLRKFSHERITGRRPWSRRRTLWKTFCRMDIWKTPLRLCNLTLGKRKKLDGPHFCH